MRKKCTKCGRIKALSDFYIRKNRLCGYSSECKQCLILRAKLNRNANLERYKISSKAYYQKNRDIKIKENCAYKKTAKGKAVQRKYDKSLKGVARRKRAIKKYYHSEKGKIAWATAKENRAPILQTYMKTWRQTPGGRACVKAYTANRKKAGHISADLIKGIENANVRKYGILTCEYCEIPVGDKYHLDHKIPISRGGKSRKVNLCISCPECNVRKRTLTPEEYRRRLKVV